MLGPSATLRLRPAALQFFAGLGVQPRWIAPMAGDVSPRKYYRLENSGGTLVLCDEGAPGDACRRFRTTTGILDSAGVRVPRIHAHEVADGLLLLEDLGDTSLAQLPTSRSATDVTWARAARHLEHIAMLPGEVVAAVNPPLGHELLRREIDQTIAVALAPNMHDAALLAAISEALHGLCSTVGAGPLQPAHRDYMGRNLMLLEDGEVGVLDHQDLRLAPAHYDLACLLYDSCRVSKRARAEYIAGLGCPRIEFDRVVAQRLFKIIGTFFSFARRGYPRHLGMVPGALEHGWRALVSVPEGANLRHGRRLAIPTAFEPLLAATKSTARSAPAQNAKPSPFAQPLPGSG